jgi:serine/threonine protein kinase/tetratricopeptide (TPR) repeat protein
MAPPLDPIASLRAALRGHYDIEREIGQGAFATVYLARDLKHERKVALKVLNADPTSETGELRFIREIRTLARLQHPNILPLHDSGHVEALLYYVMPYVSGDTLRDRISRERQISVESSCNIARDIADALAYAHAQGVIHRDIKPENILLSTGHPILADFGIARAIDLAGVRQLTRTGAASPGTPAYMSPEQLMGDRELDGRSDIYSLGCVLFEMLTGKPPFSGKEGFVKRFTEVAPAASQLRANLPEWVDEAIAGALQRSPEDRYATAKQFFVALCEPGISGESHRRSDPTNRLLTAVANVPVGAVSSDSQRNAREHAASQSEQTISGGISNANHRQLLRSLTERVRTHPKVTTALVVSFLAAALAFASPGKRPRLFSNLGGGASLDTARFAVLPFAAAGQLGAHVGSGFYDAVTVWDGLPLVPDTKVAQAIAEQGLPTTESQAMELGKRLGAGKVIWGTAVGNAGSARVRVHLYDVTSRESKDDFVFDESNSTGNSYSLAANRLIGVHARPSAAEGCDNRTRSFVAWSACGLGHVALKKWELGDAERQFRAAIAADADYAPPRFWLAQILSWKGFETRSEWRDQIAHAIAQENSLSPRDATLASALSALALGQFPEACRTYRNLTRSNQRDFVAWYGLGECQARDSLVVSSRGVSPSGWEFRGSYDAAAKSYMRAVRIEPGAHALLSFDRMQFLLPTAPVQIRMGHGGPPERRMFAAYPTLTRDTLSFVPYTFDAFGRLSAREIATQPKALEHDSDMLLEFATNWTQQSSDDPAAFEALADVLETRGQLSDGTGTTPSALAAIHRARSLASNADQRVRIGGREVLIRFKRSEFPLARTLADSVLAEADDSVYTDLRLLGGLAGLTGRLSRATIFARISGAYLPSSGPEIPTSLSAPAAAFFTSAAFGICGPATDRIEQELDRDISSAFSEDDRERARAELKSRPISLLAPCTNGLASLKIPNSTDKLVRMQQALARHDARLLKALLDSATAMTRMQRPSDLSLDYAYQLSWIRLASGDTASAIQYLDIALGALPSLSSASLRDIAPAAAAVRAMALRAELAATRKDPQTARRWASAVVALWSGAEAPLQPVVGKMRILAGTTNRK